MRCKVKVLLLLAPLAIVRCMGAGDEAPAPDETAYDADTLASVEYPPEDVTRGAPSPEDVDLGSPPPGDVDLGAPMTESPGQESPGQEGMALGWVSVSSSDGSSYEVWQQGSARGHTSIRLGQRPGVASYELRDEAGRRVCRGRVDVKRYETLCIQCDVATGEFRRVAC